MWSLRRRPEDNTFYLIYDRDRRYNWQLRGVWEYLCGQDNEYTQGYIRTARQNGYLICNDNEGNVRILILE